MVAAFMMFRGVVTQVFLSEMPSHIKFSIFHLIADVEISHFHGAGALFLDGSIGNACSRGIIAVEWCGWLRVAKFFQGESIYLAFFCSQGRDKF
jgi:hypothetical protein